MKKNIIRVGAVLLSLVVVAGSALCAIMFEESYYYTCYGEMISRHPFKTVLVERPIWDYYSKTPKWFDPHKHYAEDFFESFYSDQMSVARATFVSEKNSKNCVSYSFKVNEWLRKERESQSSNITLTQQDHKNLWNYSDDSSVFDIYTSYRTIYELMLSYYGVQYEKGQEYLVVYNSSYTLGSLYYFAPLDGEYPYIEIYPGATRYDATYFGAETKYVTADEFVELCMKAANEYSAANGFS